jgi:hypothetical protein
MHSNTQKSFMLEKVEYLKDMSGLNNENVCDLDKICVRTIQN